MGQELYSIRHPNPWFSGVFVMVWVITLIIVGSWTLSVCWSWLDESEQLGRTVMIVLLCVSGAGAILGWVFFIRHIYTKLAQKRLNEAFIQRFSATDV